MIVPKSREFVRKVKSLRTQRAFVNASDHGFRDIGPRCHVKDKPSSALGSRLKMELSIQWSSQMVVN